MKLRIGLFPVLLISVLACTDGSLPTEFDPKPTGRIDPAQSEYYGPVEPALRKLLEEQRLLLWRDNSDPDLREKGLASAKSSLKLGKDTVETPDEINGSSYLVTRAWWQVVAKDCSQHGRRYTVKPFAADR